MISINTVAWLDIVTPYRMVIIHIDGPNGKRQHVVMYEQIIRIALYKDETMKLEVIEENVPS